MFDHVKACKLCKTNFKKKVRESFNQWEARKYCSISCRNRDTKPIPVHIRFWSYVNKSNECWAWTGSTDEHGYGRISLYVGSSPLKAHRLSYEMRNGPIPEGMVIRHKCDNPNCVNPDHLEIGTQKDNARDMVERGRFNEKVIQNLKREPALTAKQVREIESINFVSLNGRGIGEKVQDVAKRYGVSTSVITQIKKGTYTLSNKGAA